MRATLSVCFFRASSTMRSTVELLRIRPTSPPILSTLRTFDHKITSNITSKTMPRAALIVATRFEIRDISAIPTNVHAHLYVSKRIQRFLALLENVITNIYIYREIDFASILSRTLLAHQFIILWWITSSDLRELSHAQTHISRHSRAKIISDIFVYP